MPRTIVTPIAVPESYADTTVAVTWTAADVANKNRLLLTGREVLLCRNAGGTGRAVTITSVADEMGRTNDITFTLGNAESKVFPFFKLAGWVQSDGYLYFEGAHAEVEWLALRLP